MDFVSCNDCRFRRDRSMRPIYEFALKDKTKEMFGVSVKKDNNIEYRDCLVISY